MSYDVIDTRPSISKLSLREQFAGLSSIPERRPERVQAAALGDLGADTFCLGGSCTTGDAAVRQMVSTFNSFKPSAKPGFVDQFEAQVQGLQKEAAGISWAARFFIIGQGCCAMKEIGERAVAVTQAMFSFQGLKPSVSTPPAAASLLSTLLSFLIPALLVGGTLYLVAPSVRGWVSNKLSSKQHVSGLGGVRRKRVRR